MNMYFQTDRTGNTWHIESEVGLDQVGRCGVEVAGSQWVRQSREILDGGRLCSRCSTGTGALVTREG